MCLFGCISQTGVGVSQSPAQAASIAVGTGQITQGVDQPWEGVRLTPNTQTALHAHYNFLVKHRLR